MGCGCGQGQSWYYAYELAFEDGSTIEFDTLEPARQAQAERGGVIRTRRLQTPLATA